MRNTHAKTPAKGINKGTFRIPPHFHTKNYVPLRNIVLFQSQIIFNISPSIFCIIQTNTSSSPIKLFGNFIQFKCLYCKNLKIGIEYFQATFYKKMLSLRNIIFKKYPI